MKHSICLVSDFFYPNFGGVETHVWCLAQCLMQLGHKVIVVTHAYPKRSGIRIMTNGLKVYYLPLMVVFDQVILPTLCSFLPLFRNILIRERISIVHGHQSVSVMANECLFYARCLGFRTVFTDHSLFGFDNMASICISRLQEITLSDVDHVICVSHTCRENLVLRARLHPSLISTIPNAVDTTRFTPDPSRRPSGNRVNIVIVSRLVYRKGIDLLVLMIPILCERLEHVHFIIGGDGPKLLQIEEMRERYLLHDRVELLGAVQHSEVRDVLVRGHVFLNCSLTESFCIALLEAAACGLFVVSTKVGGVPEVLPTSMIKFAEPNVDALVDAVIEAVLLSGRVDPVEFHSRVRTMYSWIDVTKRVETVYNHVAILKRPKLITRLLRYMTVGPFTGVLVCILVVLMHFLRLLLEYIWPAGSIEVSPDIVLDSTRVAVKNHHRRVKQEEAAAAQ